MSHVFYLVGPTASGKSALAVELAERLNAEIVNGDAFQLYRGLEILTAAPTAAEHARVPHHLYGVLSLEERCDAARYADLARRTLAELKARGKVALVVGGSGLYLKALTHGLAELPSDPAVRAELAARSLEENFAELQRRDPEEAARINRHNPRYVERALEICRLTGQPVSQLRQTWKGPDPEELRGVALVWPREALHARINARTEVMLTAGALEEVMRVERISITAEKALGFRELRALAAGEMTREEALARIQQATRRYAKRQMTWFRREKWLHFLQVDPTEPFPSPRLQEEALIALHAPSHGSRTSKF